MTSQYNVRANMEYTEGRRDGERGIFKSPKRAVKPDPNFLKAIQSYIKTEKKDNIKAERIRRLK